MSVRKKSKVDREDGGGLATETNNEISKILHLIKLSLEKMPTRTSLTVSDVLCWSKKAKITIPWVGLPREGASSEREKLRFGTAPPTSIVVVGSFLLGTMVEPSNVDLAVEMPAGLLKEKDELDYRYLLGRSYFLATIAERLGDTPELKGASIYWETFRGHILKPILIVKPENHNVKIRIHVSLPSERFKFQKFLPTKNLVRTSSLLTAESFTTNDVKVDKVGDLQNDLPTPIYNSLILSDALMVSHLKIINSECKRIPPLKDAIKLGKAWIQQRGYNKYHFHLNGFQLSMFYIFLAKTNRIDGNMTELQIFKILMAFFTEVNWSKPMFIINLHEKNSHLPDYDNSDGHFVASLVESTSGMNILFDWTAEVISEICHDARRALNCLNNSSQNFDGLFLVPDRMLSKFDAYYTINDFTWMPDLKANFGHYKSQFIPELARVKMIAKKLKFALNSRISSITVHLFDNCDESSLPKPWGLLNNRVGVGLLFNRSECQRIVELGPLADNVDNVKQFRSFWRERSELRRFADGSIREAVAWDQLKNSRHHVIPDILQFVFGVHFGSHQINFADAVLDFAWTSNAAFTPVQEAHQNLSKYIRAIDGLPLAVTRCEVINSCGFMTSISPPKPIIQSTDSTPLKFQLSSSPPPPVIETLIYLERSNRWPEEYYGMLYAKQAFSVQICRHLNDNYGLQTSVTLTFFDVLINGFVFRCWINHESEIKLMHQQGLNTEAMTLLYEERPKHARFISALAQGDSIFGPTCRLFKKWIWSQMYSLQFTDEIVDLIVASIFLQGQEAPNSVLSGFIRTLELLVNHPWKSLPLLVDFERGESKSWSVEKALKVYHQHHRVTKEEKRPVLYIAPSYQLDNNPSIWSIQSRVTEFDILHLQKLSKAALNFLTTTTSGGFAQDGEADILFRPSLDRFTIHAKVSLEFDQKSISFIGRKSEQDRFLRFLPGFDPVQSLIEELRKVLPKTTLIYYNSDNEGIMTIGIILPKKANLNEAMETLKATGRDMFSFIKTPQAITTL